MDDLHKLAGALPIDLQADLRPQVISALTKDTLTPQQLYDKMKLTLPGYHPMHFVAECWGWILRSQLRVVYSPAQRMYLQLWDGMKLTIEDEKRIERQGKDIRRVEE